MKIIQVASLMLLPLMSSSLWAADKNPIIIENRNVIASAGMYCGDCTTLSGTHLIECMSCLDSQQLVDNFNRLNSRAALYFLKSLDDTRMLEFIQHFSDEAWAIWHAKLPADQQKYINGDRKKIIENIRKNSFISAEIARKTALLLAMLLEWTLRIALR